MRLVLRIIRHSPGPFAALTFWAVFIYAVVPVPIGLMTQKVFDDITSRTAAHGVWIAIGILVGLQVADVVGQLGLGFPWSSIQQRTASLLQHDLMAGILRGYGRYGLSQPPAAALARFRDEPGAITSGSLDALSDLTGRTVFAVVAAVVMWRINPWATVAAFSPVLATATVSDALGTRAAKYGGAARQATAALSGFVGEVAAGHLAVTAGGAADRVVARAAAMGEERRRLAVRDTVFTQLLNSLNFHVVNLSTGVVLLVVAASVRSGHFSVGDLALFVVFLDELTYLPDEVGRLISELKNTDKALERMQALVPGEESSAIGSLIATGPRRDRTPFTSALARLEVRNLTYHYPGSSRGIEDISFGLERSGLTVVTGRIGSGKTTLLHALVGLLPVEHGAIYWNDELVEDPSSFLVPPRAALCSQVPRLFSQSLGDNLLLGRHPGPGELAAALATAVFDPETERLEHGLDTLVGPRGVKLSGGQVQRAAAARMLLTGAELLVIDDLSSALDPETEARLWDRLFRRLPTLTCLAVSHRPVARQRADRVLVLEDGRLVDGG